MNKNRRIRQDNFNTDRNGYGCIFNDYFSRANTWEPVGLDTAHSYTELIRVVYHIT